MIETYQRRRNKDRTTSPGETLILQQPLEGINKAQGEDGNHHRINFFMTARNRGFWGYVCHIVSRSHSPCLAHLEITAPSLLPLSTTL